MLAAMPGAPDPYLQPTWFVNSDDPAVAAFAAGAAGGGSEAERAGRLFLAVRDGIRYDAYTACFDPDTFRASTVLRSGASWCVPKAVLLTAACRALGIPSRLGFADVVNHLATPRLLEFLGTDVFAFHGYSEILVGGKWLKATPAFNAALCAKFGVEPLVFDGEHDALFQPFDRAGHRHMEYVRDRGTHADLPLGELHRVWKEVYPGHFARGYFPADLPPIAAK